MPSQYSAENVCVSGGGRAALTRAAASLGHVNLGHFLPDYTAYEELLDIFKAFTAIPILLEGEHGYAFGADDLRREVLGRGFSAILMSNPCNPTGKLVEGEELARWVVGRARARLRAAARRVLLALRLPQRARAAARRERRALRRGRRPRSGRRLRRLHEELALPRLARHLGARAEGRRRGARRAPGRFLDGGGSKPLQRAAVPLLAEDHVVAETKAIQTAFRAKRDYLLSQLERLGVRVDRAPDGTFYVWGSVEKLPPPLNDGMGFFRAALEEKVIVVPGEFFDVNPGKRRHGRASRFKGYVRFSFGPAMSVMEKAVERFERMIARA